MAPKWILNLKLITRFSKLPNLFFLKKCIQNNIPLNGVRYIAPEKLKLLQSGVIIERGRNDFLLESVKYIDALCGNGVTVFSQEGEKLFARVGNINYEIQTSEEVYILHEIFVKGEYNFYGPEKYVLIDIGMNVGITSLYFAAKAACTSIIGFEPFKPTYDQALQNFELNPECKGKIKCYNYGLGRIDETLHIKYNPALKGGMSSISAPNESVQLKAPGTLMESIEIRGVGKVFDDLLITEYKNDGCKIVVKMDCEGAEYGIMLALQETGNLEKIDSMMIEWHGGEPLEIIRALTNAGFSAWLFDSFHTYGMIYAVRQRNHIHS